MKLKPRTAVQHYRCLLLYCFIAALMSLPIACTSPQVEKLRWLYSADAEKAFRKDLKAARLKFYVVYGYSSEIPGIGRLNHSRCFGEVELAPIKGTSDALESPEHLRLNKLARSFAKKYNLLVKDHLARAGTQTCPTEPR